MQKLISMKIKNFQKHRNREFNFSEYTGIVGPTNEGKSSIIRAMFWCLYNIPPAPGTSFITRGESECSVTLTFDSGLKITRTRGKSQNNYHVVSENGEEFDLDNFGSGPVKKIINLHNMRLVDYLGNEKSLNFRTQLEPPFFLGENATMRGVMIGKLGHADIVDLAIKNAASTLRSKNAEKKNLSEKIKNIKSEIKSLGNLDKIEKTIEYSNLKLTKIKALKYSFDSIIALKDKLLILYNEKEVLEKLCSVESDVNVLLNICDTLTTLIKRFSKLNDADIIYSILRENKEKFKNCVSNGNEVDLVLECSSQIFDLYNKFQEILNIANNTLKLESEFEKIKSIASFNTDDVLNKLDELTKFNLLFKYINDMALGLFNFKSERDKNLNNYQYTEKQYDIALREYKNLLNSMSVCPVCLSKMSDSKRSKMMSEIKL